MYSSFSHYYIAYSFIKQNKHIQIFGCGILDLYLSDSEWNLSSASLSKARFFFACKHSKMSGFRLCLSYLEWVPNYPGGCFLCLFSFSVLKVSVSSACLVDRKIFRSKVYPVCSKRAIPIHPPCAGTQQPKSKLQEKCVLSER